MLATGNERCPVKFLEKPVLMRPPSLKQSGPLYLRPLEKTKRDVWFSTQPVGVNKINFYEKELARLGGLECTNKRFTNHSIHKTTVHKLQKTGVFNYKIAAAVTGHRYVQSLRDYDMQDHQHIISILSKACAVPPPAFHRDASQQLVGSSCPQYHFTNCNVYIYNGCSSSSSSQVLVNPLLKRCCVILDSNDDV